MVYGMYCDRLGLTFTVFKSDSPVVGKLHSENFSEVTEAVVDGCDICAGRHNHQDFGAIGFADEGVAFDVPGR